jgi:phage terminase large subunit-like protein
MVAGLTAAGYAVRPLKADADKITRALAATAKVARREVYLPADAPWLDEFLGELVTFPNGRHDDQVDTLAYTAREIQRGLVHDVPSVDRPAIHAPVATPEGVEILSDHRLANLEF